MLYGIPTYVGCSRRRAHATCLKDTEFRAQGEYELTGVRQLAEWPAARNRRSQSPGGSSIRLSVLNW